MSNVNTPTTCLQVAEVAERLNVSKAAIYRLVERGQMPHIRIGSLIRITTVQFEEFLRSNTTGGNADA